MSDVKSFIISDLHLGHRNIVKYCSRPFINTHEMNVALVANWNNAVSNNDTVYFLGDLSRRTDFWFEKLNGNIVFIKGNHDSSEKIKFYQNYVLEYRGYKFFLSHRPNQAPKDWTGWSIFGHVHNNRLEEYPFIDIENKRINISIELIDYRPMNIDDLIRKIEKYT